MLLPVPIDLGTSTRHNSSHVILSSIFEQQFQIILTRSATMAGLEQFHSFIGSLCHQGLDAKLNVELSGGEAWIKLRLGLEE